MVPYVRLFLARLTFEDVFFFEACDLLLPGAPFPQEAVPWYTVPLSQCSNNRRAISFVMPVYKVLSLHLRIYKNHSFPATR